MPTTQNKWVANPSRLRNTYPRDSGKQACFGEVNKHRLVASISKHSQRPFRAYGIKGVVVRPVRVCPHKNWLVHVGITVNKTSNYDEQQQLELKSLQRRAAKLGMTLTPNLA